MQRWIATRGQTIFKNNVPVSFHGVALDITDRKRIEEALERRVEARTRELKETILKLHEEIKQREIAESEVQQLQRLDAIGQITSGVAHDFNNLLSVVITNARLLSHDGMREPSEQEGIELIRTAAQRGVDLVAQLLAFSRRQRLEPNEVDINNKLAGMTGLLNVTLGGTVQLRTVFAPNLWPALVDPTQIELIVLNLVLNARDAMPSGGVVTLETRNVTVDSPVGGRKGRLLDSTLCYSSVIRVQVFRTMSSFTFSNLFSLPSNLGRTPASASPKWSVSRSNRAEVSESRRASERVPR